ncbi:hypothetical protein P0F65_07640 [Sphingomonas sp. I4]
MTASKRDTTRDHFAGQVVQVAGAELELGGVGGTSKLADRMTVIASTYLGPGATSFSSGVSPTPASPGRPRRPSASISGICDSATTRPIPTCGWPTWRR